MKNILFFFKKNQLFLYIIVFIVIIIDILISLFYNYPMRLFIHYLLFPALVCISLLKKHKSYFILLLYEFIISSLAFYDLIGFSVLTYFWAPDIWSIFNMLSVDPTILELPVWFQPILVVVFFMIFSLIVRKKKKS